MAESRAAWPEVVLIVALDQRIIRARPMTVGSLALVLDIAEVTHKTSWRPAHKKAFLTRLCKPSQLWSLFSASLQRPPGTPSRHTDMVSPSGVVDGTWLHDLRRRRSPVSPEEPVDEEAAHMRSGLPGDTLAIMTSNIAAIICAARY